MSNIDYIINLCFDLAEQGKTPSVALIRNASSQPLSIPSIVKALQYWKSNPKSRPTINKQSAEKSSENKQSLEHRVSQLEEKVATLTRQLTKLTKG